MKSINKALAIAGVTASVAAAGLVGMGAASAATTTSSTSNNPMSSLVSAIAKKFNLNTSDVQAVFDEQKATMDATRETELKTTQAQLVKDGKITQAQSDAITAKRAELKKERDADMSSSSTKTDTDRRTEMATRKTALDTWLKAQGIDTQYAYLVMSGGHGHGGPGRADDSTSTSATTN